MTARQLATIILRLWGCIWVLRALVTFLLAFGIAMAMRPAGRNELAMENALAEIAGLIAGAVLLFASERIANVLFADGNPLAMSVSAPEMQRLGFSMIGVYYVANGLVHLAQLTYLYGSYGPTEVLIAQYGDNLGSSVGELIVGIAIFLGSRALSNFWQRLRGRP